MDEEGRPQPPRTSHPHTPQAAINLIAACTYPPSATTPSAQYSYARNHRSTGACARSLPSKTPAPAATATAHRTELRESHATGPTAQMRTFISCKNLFLQITSMSSKALPPGNSSESVRPPSLAILRPCSSAKHCRELLFHSLAGRLITCLEFQYSRLCSPHSSALPPRVRPKPFCTRKISALLATLPQRPFQRL